MIKALFTTLCICAAVTVAAQTNNRRFVTDSLTPYVDSALAVWQIPGAAVCIVKDGKVVLQKGFGVKEINGSDKVDENTLFMIGSNTKAFTATAIAMLDIDKKISLDDKVTKWIPAFKLQNKAAGEQAIVRDLLCHRIGFNTFQGDFTYWTSNLSRKDIIEKMSHIKARYPFRTTWGYTNAAFLVAGEIIPAASGLQWEDFITQKIFAPLGMKNSIALSKDFFGAANKCSAHTMADGKLIKIPFCNIDNIAAAGSIGSSVSDMSKWVLMQLNNGKYEGNTVVPSKALAQTWLPHSILGNGGKQFNSGHFNLYGLGWFLEEYCGKKIVSHTGGVNGFVTSVTLLPEEKLGVLVFTNTDQNAFYEALKWEIVDAYLDKPYRNYSNLYAGFFKQQQLDDNAKHQKMLDSVALKLTPGLPLSAYCGSYVNEVYGTMDVVQEVAGELRMKFSHHPNMYASLAFIGNHRFYATFSDPEFSKAVFPFTIVNGKVKGVTVKVADFIEMDAYEFKKVK
jgi:CubicO group peptidase (beta-lactamase class C family)